MKTKLFFLLLVFNLQFSIFNCFAQAGEWVWLKGDSIPDQPGSYGVQGVPSPTNNPPSLYEPCEWTDLNGNFWLFGGVNTGGSVSGALWKYEPATNEWTWMKGPDILNSTGNFGIQGVSSPTNNPPGLGYGMISWTDTLGSLWTFGGRNSLGNHNAMWKYDISTNEWTWMKGPFVVNNSGSFGTQGIPASSNNPPSRSESSVGWVDTYNDLWLFGGQEDFPVYGPRNDVWRYNIATNQWTWMKGAQAAWQGNSYGTLGIEANSNHPGSRWAYCHWKDNTGKFWLLGGQRRAYASLNDLWRYNPATNRWAWMGGATTPGSSGSYNTLCAAAPSLMPRSKFENRAAWVDQSGNFWVFGGGISLNSTATMNDLWKYCVAANQWIFIKGNSSMSPPGLWGTMGVSNPSNKPDGRGGSIGWTDNNGHLYLFGGLAAQINGWHNDLWKFTIDTTCGVCPATTSIDENSHSASTIEIFPNPSSESFTIRSTDYAIYKIEIFNLLGEEVYEKQLSAAECQLSTRRFGNGIYIVKIYTHEGVLQKKLMVNR